MVECERIPFMTLTDWVVYNLKVYSIEIGGEEPTILATLILGDYFWDKLMKTKVKGKPLIKHLLRNCIKNPLTRDEDEWYEYMRCVEEKLFPVFQKLEPHLKQMKEEMKKALKEVSKKVNEQ